MSTIGDRLKPEDGRVSQWRLRARLEPRTLGDLITELLVVVQVMTGYPAPAQPPTVTFLAAEELQERACGRPCAVLGWYEHGSSIFLDDRLDPENDFRAQAILVHELVHYLQEKNGAFGVPQTCERWAAREREAYTVQFRWMRESHPEVIPRMRRPPPPGLFRCHSEPAAISPADGSDPQAG